MAKKSKIVDFSAFKQRRYKTLPNPVSSDNLELTVGDFFLMIKVYDDVVKGYDPLASEEERDKNEHQIFQFCKKKIGELVKIKTYIIDKFKNKDMGLATPIGMLSHKHDDPAKEYAILITMLDFAVFVSSLANLLDAFQEKSFLFNTKKVTLSLQCAFTLRKLLSFCDVIDSVDPTVYPLDYPLAYLYLRDFDD